MSKPVNQSVVLFVASVGQSLVGLLSLACTLNKSALFESEPQSGRRPQSTAYWLSASIINIINVMPIKPISINVELMGKWHRLTSRPVGKVNI